MAMQLSLYDIFENINTETDKDKYVVDSFSAGGFCNDNFRQALEQKYKPILEVSDKFDRQNVSYQLSKKDVLHSWLKYKEGFSAELVNILLDDIKPTNDDVIMDPFMGSGTTALVCQMRGINSIGYDIMPISKVAITVKANVMRYNILEIEDLIKSFRSLKMPDDYSRRTPYITITKSAYPEFNEKFIQYATEWINSSNYTDGVKNLFILCVLNSLERCSYTSKSGQYLSWDARSKKVIEANEERLKKGRKLLPIQFCRDNIENINEAIIDELKHVLVDIRLIQRNNNTEIKANIDFKQSSVLFELPKLDQQKKLVEILKAAYATKRAYQKQIIATEELVKSQFIGDLTTFSTITGGVLYA